MWWFMPVSQHRSREGGKISLVNIKNYGPSIEILSQMNKTNQNTKPKNIRVNSIKENFIWPTHTRTHTHMHTCTHFILMQSFANSIG